MTNKEKRQTLSNQIYDTLHPGKTIDGAMLKLCMDSVGFIPKNKTFAYGMFKNIKDTDYSTDYEFRLFDSKGNQVECYLERKSTKTSWDETRHKINKYTLLIYPYQIEELEEMKQKEEAARLVTLNNKKKRIAPKVKKGITYVGKYMNKPVTEMLKDEPYCIWLSREEWFKEECPTFYEKVKEVSDNYILPQ